MKLLGLLLVSLLAFSCSDKTASTFQTQAQQSSIINGIPVTADNLVAKSVVGILMSNGQDAAGKIWGQGCTGSVLNSKFILTAAHCVQGDEANNLLVHFSLKTITREHQSNPNREPIEKYLVVRKVKSFLTHPDYTGSGSYDLAVLMLETEAPADAVPVTLLPAEFVNEAAGQTTFEGQNLPVVLMGFGLVKENPMTRTDVLRQTTVPSKFFNRFVVTDQTKGSGGCNGDSGGPAFLTHKNVVYQVGVTHGPHGSSTTCREQGEWYNPSFDKGFLQRAQDQLKTQ